MVVFKEDILDQQSNDELKYKIIGKYLKYPDGVIGRIISINQKSSNLFETYIRFGDGTRLLETRFSLEHLFNISKEISELIKPIKI